MVATSRLPRFRLAQPVAVQAVTSGSHDMLERRVASRVTLFPAIGTET